IYADFRRTALGRAGTPVWSVVGLHRPAEFNRGHVPAFLAGEEPRDYLCVYPFVRSYEWYLLPDDERRQMLAEHGRMAAPFPDVRANTVSTFGLSDYEWLLGFEANELHRIVDLVRALRADQARRHTRLEIPFFTRKGKSVAELMEALPWPGGRPAPFLAVRRLRLRGGDAAPQKPSGQGRRRSDIGAKTSTSSINSALE